LSLWFSRLFVLNNSHLNNTFKTVIFHNLAGLTRSLQRNIGPRSFCHQYMRSAISVLYFSVKTSRLVNKKLIMQGH
jgi:hypothetical protein